MFFDGRQPHTFYESIKITNSRVTYIPGTWPMQERMVDDQLFLKHNFVTKHAKQFQKDDFWDYLTA